MVIDRSRLRILIGLLCLLASPLDLHASAWSARRAALDRVYQTEEFRIFYTLSGKDALPPETRQDGDHDDIPDLIEDIGIQLVTARSVYADVIRLRHPFQSPRYNTEVRHIDVNLLRFPLRKGGPRKGLAGDKVIHFSRPIDGDDDVGVLVIDISNSIEADNYTPAHELFHLFQYGYTLFKNRWFTEGTARWAEYAFKPRSGAAGQLPATSGELTKLLEQDYKASRFWNKVCEIVDPVGILDMPNDILEQQYLGISQHVVVDKLLHGATFMKTMLEGLDRMDDVASEARGLDPLNWKESLQKSSVNNPYLLRAVRELLVNEFGQDPENDELRRFISLLGTEYD